ncbi:MAG: putative radical family enzyme coproporphyrinogen oxidase, oxygen-independent [Anaerocolumna sp.]|jgi:oxygen-independent coproporphyrinogen-3 oxidase|nr:putative radical family enzyme coproporphyrinogen oxidase, oxygen-independent [Anaerocolumna sp.]
MGRELFTSRNNLSWFYPKLCKFQDDAGAIEGVLNNNYKDDGIDKLLYIHIPFCDSFCSYCACFKELIHQYNDQDKLLFINSLVKEMSILKKLNNDKKIKIRYIQFGGGTPSCLSNDLLLRLFDGISENMDLSENEGISFEGNVMSLNDYEKLKILKVSGVTRVSFGVQTFNKLLRKELNIKAKLSDVFGTVEKLNMVGINSYALDLIYNLPNQTMDMLENDLEIAGRELKPAFIQTYQFNQFNNTTLSNRIRGGEFKIQPTEEREKAMSEFIQTKMNQLGYGNRVLINLFSNVDTKPWTGIEMSLGNNKYNGSNMIGIGPGAMSYLKESNHRNVCSVRDYIGTLEKNMLPIECGHLSGDEEKLNKVMVCFPAFTKMKKMDIPEDNQIREKLKVLIENGYINEDDQNIALSEKGLDWAGNISYFFYSESEVKRIKNSYYQSIKHNRNPFNQDNMNIAKKVN